MFDFSSLVAEIDIQDLIDNQIKTGEPITLTIPKHVTVDTKKALDRLTTIINRGMNTKKAYLK